MWGYFCSFVFKGMTRSLPSFFKILFICLFFAGSISLLLLLGFLCLRQAGTTLQLQCSGLLWWLLSLRSTDAGVHGLPWLQHMGSVVVAHRLSCSMAWGIFLDRGLNPCSLHWQADALPLEHQECPIRISLNQSPFYFTLVFSLVPQGYEQSKLETFADQEQPWTRKQGSCPFCRPLLVCWVSLLLMFFCCHSR